MKAKYSFLLLLLVLFGGLQAETGYADSPSGSLTSLPPEAPALSAPMSGTINAPINAELSWVKLLHAASYRLQVSTLPDFSILTINQPGLTEIHHTAGGLLHQTLYYWRIQGENRAGSSLFSPVWSLTTVPAAPTAPVLSTPQNGAAGVSVNALFAWNPSSKADSYHLQGSTLPDFSVIAFEKTDVAGTWHQYQGLAPGTMYFWHVRALNAGGASEFSPMWTFTTIVAAPAPPTLVSPENGGSTSPDTDLKWNVAAGALTYHIQVSSDPQFALLTAEPQGLTTTWFSLRGLEANKTYYWRVSAVNTGGESLWSEVWHFGVGTLAENKHGGEHPTDFALSPAYPNPFNGGTVINWQLPAGADISLRIYNAAGRLVREPASGYHEGGRYSFVWDGRDAFGELVGSGLYFCRFQAEGRVFMQKLSLIR